MNGVINNQGFNFLSLDISNNFARNWGLNNTISGGIAVAVSASGQYQIGILSPSQYVYGSTNYGVTWRQIYSIACQSASISASGQYQIAISNSSIFISTTFGDSWNDKTPTNLNWQSAAISASGQYQTAIGYQRGIWVSTNYGNSWNQVLNNTHNWRDVAMSTSGQYQTAVTLFTSPNTIGSIWYSNNYGVNWTQYTNVLDPSGNYSSVAISSSGQYQTTVINGGSIYYSTNYGVNWTQSDASSNSWFSVAMTASGQYQTAVINGGSIYYSTNYGVTWSIVSGTSGLNWQSVAISASGQYQTAVVQGGGIYTSVLPINISSTLTLNNDPGGYPQVLTSQGPGKPPYWTTPVGSTQWSNGSNNSINYSLGFVGIGKSNPTSTLDVSGNINIGPVGSTTSGLIFPDGTVQNTAGIAPTLTTVTNYNTIGQNLVPYTSLNNFAQISTIYTSAVSSDGQYQILNYKDINNAERTILSSDYGISWRGILQGEMGQPFGVAISETGQYITISAFNGGGIRYSNNYGNSFSAFPNINGDRPNITAMSYNGKYQIVLGMEISSYYYTSNYGDPWIVKATTNNAVAIDCAISETGQYQIVSLRTSDLSLSTNYGANFSIVKPNGATGQTYISVAISNSGQYMVATDSSGVIYRSSNTGSIWSSVTVPGISGSSYVSITSSGQYQALFTKNITNGYYISTNYGSNWTQINSGMSLTNIANYPSKQAISGSGNILLVFGEINQFVIKPVYISKVTTTLITSLSLNGTVTATNFNATSDYRIKENVKLLEDSFILDDLKPVTYLNKKTGNTDIGLLAHELQEIYPFLVTGVKDGSEMQSINYIGLIGILIKEIQDLKKEVAALSTLSTFKKG